MSPLVTWPRTPVPATVPASTPLSAAILRTEGGIGIDVPPAARCVSGLGRGSSSAALIGVVPAVLVSGRPVATPAESPDLVALAAALSLI